MLQNAAPEPEVKLGNLPMLIGYALRRAQIAVFQDFHQSFAAHDIRPTQFSVLHVLKHNPGLRQTQVSQALGIKRTNFVPLFDVLEQRGLAERRPVDGDRRSFALFLTEAGAVMVEQLDEIVTRHEARIAANLGPDGRLQLLGLLSLLAEKPADPA